MVLLALVFTVGIRFVIALSGASESALARSAQRRTLELTRQAIDTDFSALVGCDRAGLDVPLVSIDATSVTVYSDVGRDGVVDLVGWRIRNGVLERAQVTPAVCSAPSLANAAWRPYVSGVRDPRTGEQAFSAIRLGQLVVSAQTCTGAGAASCNFDALRIDFDAEPTPGAGPVPFSATYPLPQRATRL